MKILHISTTDSGGAANSAIRLHKGLLEIGVESNMLFLDKNNESIPNSHYWRIPKLSYKHALGKKLGLYTTLKQKHQKRIKDLSSDYEAIHFPTTSYDITEHRLVQECDVINLHSAAA